MSIIVGIVVIGLSLRASWFETFLWAPLGIVLILSTFPAPVTWPVLRQLKAVEIAAYNSIQASRAFAAGRSALDLTGWMPAIVALCGGAFAGGHVVTAHELLTRQQSGYVNGPWFGGAVLAGIAMSLVRALSGIRLWIVVASLAVASFVFVVAPLGTDSQCDDCPDEIVLETTTADQQIAFVRGVVTMGWGVVVGLVATPVRKSE